jgi:hypothetical protein
MDRVSADLHAMRYYRKLPFIVCDFLVYPVRETSQRFTLEDELVYVFSRMIYDLAWPYQKTCALPQLANWLGRSVTNGFYLLD